MTRLGSFFGTLWQVICAAIFIILLVSAVLGSIGFGAKPEPPRSYSQRQQDRAEVIDDMIMQEEIGEPYRP